MALALERPRFELAPASELLRFSTAGSVDDGKSTLIGRLLHDCKGIFEDQLAAIELASRRRGRDSIDLSLITDGLRAERDQGLTIDVAYRYFATPRRSFIVADTPGHLQYTRNMVTGCSTADLAVVLLDARHGVVEQTRRHVIIAALLGVPHLIAAVNKMDLVGFDEAEFRAIADEVGKLARRLGIPDAVAIPTSALQGDNVVERSQATPWYRGPVLIEQLESVEIAAGHDFSRRRFPVQWIVRGDPAADPDYRAYAGRIDGGIFRPGDEVIVLPAGVRTRIRSIETFSGPLAEAFPPMSVAIRLTHDVDLGRGGLIVGADELPTALVETEAIVCWLGDAPLAVGGRYVLKHTSRQVRAIPTDVVDRLDVNSLEHDSAAVTLGPNEVGRVRLRLAEPIFADSYRLNRATGSAILIDEATNATVAAVLLGGAWPTAEPTP
jgi:bifunctional enzyme CysN/CysC